MAQTIKALALFILFNLYVMTSSLGANTFYQEVQIPSEFGYTNDALYFPRMNSSTTSSTGNMAVILVHQSSTHKESWIDFAQHLQAKGINSLSIEDGGRRSVLDAIKYLTAEKHVDIVLIGASIGGGAVLQATAQSQEIVKKVVLLSTSSATPITTPLIDKLFIVSKSDMWGADSYSIFDETSDPKHLIEYDGFEHGQDLLKGKNGEEITSRIIDFVTN